VREYGRVLPPFLNRYIRDLTIKTLGPILLHFKIETAYYDEMNDKIFDIDMNIDMNVCDNARNVIEPISFHRFHELSNWFAYAWWRRISLIDLCKLLILWGDYTPMCVAI
jgi:hypothetical protein